MNALFAFKVGETRSMRASARACCNAHCTLLNQCSSIFHASAPHLVFLVSVCQIFMCTVTTHRLLRHINQCKLIRNFHLAAADTTNATLTYTHFFAPVLSPSTLPSLCCLFNASVRDGKRQQPLDDSRAR